MTKNSLHSDEKLHEISKHVHYEFQMLENLLKMRWTSVAHDQAFMNAFVASFAIHSRNLIHFLFPQKIKKGDVLAEQFFAEPLQWKKIRGKQSIILRRAVKRADKEIAHITFERLNLK